MDMEKFQKRFGKTALITGASSGIGKAFAEELGALGCDLIIVARRGERLFRLKEHLEKMYRIRVYPAILDLTAAGASAELLSQVESAGLSVDILVNNAGFGDYGFFAEANLEKQLQMLDLNCKVPLMLTQAFLPAMLKQRQGAVIIVASIASLLPGPYLATYAATKSFDYAFGCALAGELAGSGVSALTLLPGLTDTEFQAGAGIPNDSWVPLAPARRVAHTALLALGHKATVVDGLLNRFLLGFAHFLPLSFVIWISGKILTLWRGPRGIH